MRSHEQFQEDTRRALRDSVETTQARIKQGGGFTGADDPHYPVRITLRHARIVSAPPGFPCPRLVEPLSEKQEGSVEVHIDLLVDGDGRAIGSDSHPIGDGDSTAWFSFLHGTDEVGLPDFLTRLLRRL